MQDRMLGIVQRIEGENRVPCLASVSELEEGERVEFQSHTIDMSSGELGDDPSLGGVVDQTACREGVHAQTLIPSIFDIEDTSVKEDWRMFGRCRTCAATFSCAGWKALRSKGSTGTSPPAGPRCPLSFRCGHHERSALGQRLPDRLEPRVG